MAVEFVKEGLSFNRRYSAMSKMLQGIMGAVAQSERSMILERQREGSAKAKEVGAYKGRQPKFDMATAMVIRGRVAAAEQIAAFGREYDKTRPTINRLFAQGPHEDRIR